MTTPNSLVAQAKFRPACWAGLVVGGLLAGCAAGPNTPTQHTSPSATAVSWLIDHLSGDENGVMPWGVKYIAFCARADAYSPAHVPDEDDLVPVEITKADFARLSPGDQCPANPEDKP